VRSIAQRHGAGIIILGGAALAALGGEVSEFQQAGGVRSALRAGELCANGEGALEDLLSRVILAELFQILRDLIEGVVMLLSDGGADGGRDVGSFRVDWILRAEGSEGSDQSDGQQGGGEGGGAAGVGAVGGGIEDGEEAAFQIGTARHGDGG